MMLLNDSFGEDNITSGNASDLPASQSTTDSGPTGWKISSPFIIVFGTFGNIMVFLVLQDRSVTHPSMAVYLRLLAVSDLIAIFDNVTLRWIRFQFGFDVWVVHEAICFLVSDQRDADVLSSWTYYVTCLIKRFTDRVRASRF
ncbi:hypothetical protein C0Q70_21105 [Pomacea canaliculata]|uniref:G-protein coupled receptors family 1 profile domain-containing protein n=1 Tax=Pomacea canaliculata TaxID=400727 RepID=A0A2T7NBL8_POMCA|nr:hypothetical protein C0Q70_21105 [Pomacea canaliculata]